MLSIIIPTYNESHNIKSLIERLQNSLLNIPYEIIFVDDSTDITPQVIEEETKINSNIRLHHRVNEKGLATAVMKGFDLAYGEFLCVMDADLQHPPEIIRSMYAAMLTGPDLCIPSRFIKGGSDGGLNLYRKIVSSTARYIGKIILPSIRKVSDPTSGLFMFRKEILTNAKLDPVGWKIMIEVLAMCKFNTIVEIPYCFGERLNDESKLDANVTFLYLKQLFSLRKRCKKIDVDRWTEAKVVEQLNKI